MRYRVIYSMTPSGGYNEFSADNDEEAIAEATRYPWQGRVVSLSERIGEWSSRQIEIEQVA